MKIPTIQTNSPARLAEAGSKVRAFQSVIGVDQKGRRITQQLLQLNKRFFLARERHGPGVRGCAKYRNTEPHAGLSVAGAGAASYVSRSSSQDPRFRRVCATAAE